MQTKFFFKGWGEPLHFLIDIEHKYFVCMHIQKGQQLNGLMCIVQEKQVTQDYLYRYEL